MTLVPCPHDSLFRSSMADSRVATEFFQRHLPENIRCAIDLTKLMLSPESYIDEELNPSQSDILYQTVIEEKEAYLYLLCEHQSTPDLFIPFRLLKYSVGIWTNYLKQHKYKVKKLPLIVAMVFYNGKEPYIHSMDFKDLLDASETLIEETWGKPYKLIDVQEISDEELRQHHWSGIMEFFMKHTKAKDFLELFKQVAPILYVLDNKKGADYVITLVNYALNTLQMRDHKAFMKTVKNHLTSPTGEKIMTVAEQLFEDGRQQGKQQGEHQLLIRLLKRKFSDVNKKYLSLIDKADENTLLNWGERLLDATSLAEVFDC